MSQPAAVDVRIVLDDELALITTDRSLDSPRLPVSKSCTTFSGRWHSLSRDSLLTRRPVSVESTW